MKLFIFIVAGMVLAVFVIARVGAYPVALIENTPIFYSTWKKAVESGERFINASAKSRVGGKAVDFNAPENAELVRSIKKESLTALIENVIMQQEGERIIRGFRVLALERTKNALQDSHTDSERAARFVYGLSLEDFEDLVLLPQARRDVLKEVLGEQSQAFDVWFQGIKKTKQVRLLFVPYGWSGEEVR